MSLINLVVKSRAKAVSRAKFTFFLAVFLLTFVIVKSINHNDYRVT